MSATAPHVRAWITRHRAAIPPDVLKRREKHRNRYRPRYTAPR